MTYEEALAAIASLQSRGWRLGLDRMREFLRRAGLDGALGEGSGSPRFIHIAGTNGKGSVTAYVQSILHAHGFGVGATYSPYVYDVRERVQYGLELISETDLAALTERLWPIALSLDGTDFGGPTEFEFKTALGFAYWEQRHCDWVALEVGLGGRLDATNVVTPACSTIVSIGLDHREILGDTLGAIAREKAGIIKPGRPVIVGQMAEEARDAILEVVRENGSPVWLYGREFGVAEDGSTYGPGFRYQRLTPGILGSKQPHNLAVAVASIVAAGVEVDKDHLALGARTTRAPGRMEIIEARGTRWILDGAHNAESASALAESLALVDSRGTKFVLLTGMLTGHDVLPFFKNLMPWVKSTHVSPIDFHRARNPSELAEVLSRYYSPVRAHATVTDAMTHAARDAEGTTVLVTGSFYLIGEVGRILRANAAKH
jgi:dihydrofolate synthase/folylpolyglutamate synthase